MIQTENKSRSVSNHLVMQRSLMWQLLTASEECVNSLPALWLFRSLPRRSQSLCQAMCRFLSHISINWLIVWIVIALQSRQKERLSILNYQEVTYKCKQTWSLKGFLISWTTWRLIKSKIPSTMLPKSSWSSMTLTTSAWQIFTSPSMQPLSSNNVQISVSMCVLLSLSRKP